MDVDHLCGPQPASILCPSVQPLTGPFVDAGQVPAWWGRIAEDPRIDRRMRSDLGTRRDRLMRGLGLSVRRFARRPGRGAAVALVAARALGSLLFGIAPSDPLVLVAAVAGGLAAAVGAALPPAVRSSLVDPGVALNTE